jgi:hypothetical protein
MPADGAAIPRSADLTFSVDAGRRLYDASLIVSSQPTVDPESGRLAAASWVTPWPSWHTGVHMQETGTSPPTYSYTAYGSDYYPFLLTAGTYYWQVTASLSDPTSGNPEPAVGPIETLTVNGPNPGPPAAGPTRGWGGPTAAGFPGQRLPIAFRVAAGSRTVSDVSYGGRMFCQGIPEEWLPLGGEVANSVPLVAGAFDILADRIYPTPPNGGGMATVLHIAGSVSAQHAHGTLYEQRGPDCRAAQSWSASPAYAGISSQHLPVVALVTRPRRIDRFMLVWRSDCLRPQYTHPEAWETLWLDLPNLRVQARHFALRRVFKLRNAEGDVFRVNGDLRGTLGSRLSGVLRARSRSVGPLDDPLGTKTESCDSGPVRFGVTR